MRTLSLLIAGSAVALAVPAAAQQMTDDQVAMAPVSGTLLEVDAQGRSSRVPDLATIRAGVVTQSATAAAALSDNAKRMDAVLAAIRRAGVAARDVATATVQLAPQYRYADNQPPVITGYQATNTVTIRFRDIAQSGAVLDALVAQGANQIDGPDLSIDQPDAALDEARTDAVKRARARAELYARAAGLRVVRILSIREAGEDAGGQPPRPVMFARAAAVPATKIVPGETDVTASLTVRFLLQ